MKMFKDVIDILFTSASGAFLQVTVFVGAALILFGYINYKKDGKLIEAMKNYKCCQPVIGALLGLTPGCGGAILVMPLFFRRSVTFGTVVATLIATTGDAAFVMISSVPLMFLWLSFIIFVIGVLSGFIVDALHLDIRFDLHKKFRTKAQLRKVAVCRKQVCRCMKSPSHKAITHIGHEAGDEIDMILHCQSPGELPVTSFGYRITHHGYLFYWAFLTVSIFFGISLLTGFDPTETVWGPAFLWLGILGTVFSIVLMIAGRKFLQDDTHEETEVKLMSLKETLIHSGSETAFVGTWVFIAYTIYELSIYFIGGADYAAGEEVIMAVMLSAGLLAVIVGAAVGMIPGCGPQIIFVSLYIKGLLPVEALLAHAISQDGDALFPLLALDKKTAFVATVVTTIIALAVGLGVYFLF
jgi:hypothetical protein